MISHQTVTNMNYNNGPNFSGNPYSDKVPKPTFSGTLGSNKKEDEHSQKRPPLYVDNLNNQISDFRGPNNQICGVRDPNIQQSKFSNYSEGYTNSEEVHNPYQPYHNDQMNGQNSQFSNLTIQSQFMNTEAQWKYEDMNNNTIYSNIPNITPTAYQSSRFPISYEDITSSKHITKRRLRNSDNHGNNPNQKKKSHEVMNKSNTKNVRENNNKTDSPINTSIIKIDDPSIHQGLINKKNSTGVSKELLSKLSEDDDTDDGKKEELEPRHVPGTSITLQTDEEISNWREERRKMWLLKISNNKESHMKMMGIEGKDLDKTSVLNESKKQKQFIQNIQNQVNRYNPKVNLNLRVVQREMANENEKLLQFIEELGDLGLLEHELNDEERQKLICTSNSRDKNNFRKVQRNNRLHKNNNTDKRYNSYVKRENAK